MRALTLLLTACAVVEAPPPPPPPAPAPDAPAWVAPDPASIPEGPMGEAVRRGLDLVTRTPQLLPDHAGNALRCTSCHLDGGTRPGAGPWVGITGVFPEFRPRNAKVNQLPDRINDCFERSLDGRALPVDGPDMTAIVAYMTWLSQDQPVGRSVEGRGFRRIAEPPAPDRAAGEALYARTCAACHGADGLGLRAPDGTQTFPPLWGPESFNVGAGMSRLDTAAAFVRWNMPLGQGGTLTDQEAYDVADFFIHQPRPDFAGKALDWPHGGKPRDARY